MNVHNRFLELEIAKSAGPVDLGKPENIFLIVIGVLACVLILFIITLASIRLAEKIRTYQRGK